MIKESGGPRQETNEEIEHGEIKVGDVVQAIRVGGEHDGTKASGIVVKKNEDGTIEMEGMSLEKNNTFLAKEAVVIPESAWSGALRELVEHKWDKIQIGDVVSAIPVDSRHGDPITGLVLKMNKEEGTIELKGWVSGVCWLRGSTIIPEEDWDGVLKDIHQKFINGELD